MSYSAEVYALPIPEALELWPEIGPRIQQGLDACEADQTLDFYREQVASGNAQAWMALQGNEVVGAAVTEIAEICGKRIGVLVAAQGRITEWDEFFKQAEAMFRHYGCTKSRIYGRKGWQRVLNDYRPLYVAYQKDL